MITFFTGVDTPVFLITVYAKNQKGNIADKEKNTMKILAKILTDAYRRKK